MLKKVFSKNGFMMIDNTSEMNYKMKENYYIINNYKSGKNIDDLRKEYYKSIGFRYL